MCHTNLKFCLGACKRPLRRHFCVTERTVSLSSKNDNIFVVVNVIFVNKDMEISLFIFHLHFRSIYILNKTKI